MLRIFDRTVGYFSRSVQLSGARAASMRVDTSPGQSALNRLKALYEKGKYQEAMKLLGDIEREHPSCSKATQHYRGKIAIKLLDGEESPQSSASSVTFSGHDV